MQEEICWKCHGHCEVDEPVCGYCFAQQPHSHCDDTWYTKIPCDVCCKEFTNSQYPKLIPNQPGFSKM